MLQATAAPTSPRSALQRTIPPPSVPRMASSKGRTFTVIASGGPSGWCGAASLQWNETRNAAQQAPQRWQG